MVKAPAQDPGREPHRFSVKVKPVYPENFQPIGISFAGLSRIGGDVQLDLGQLNLRRVTERIDQVRAGRQVPTEIQVDMPVAISAYLTPSAFIHLYKEVNRFYTEMKESGHILDEDSTQVK